MKQFFYDQIELLQKKGQHKMQTFDWNLFWSAFGAIGSTIGSIATAIAVIVAIKQLKQPKIMDLKIKYYVKEEYPMDEDPLFHILIINDCFKSISIESIGYVLNNKYIQLQEVSTNIKVEEFPYHLSVDNFVDLSFEYKDFNKFFEKENEYKKIYFKCIDSLKNEYITKSITIKDFLNLYDTTMDYSDVYLDP